MERAESMDHCFKRRNTIMLQERVVFIRTMMGKMKESALCQNVLFGTSTWKLALSLRRELFHTLYTLGATVQKICAKRDSQALN